MPTNASQLRSQIRSLRKQLRRCQTQLQKRVSWRLRPQDLKKGVVAWQNRRFIQCCQFLSLITDWDLAYLQLSHFCRECRKKLRQGRLKRGMKKLKKIPHPILNEKIKNIANITNYIQWLQEKNLSPNTIRSYLTILAKFPSAITTVNLRNYFLQNINQYDPTSLKVQKYALHSYIKFNKLPIEWEKLARIIPSSQRKFFATINEQDLAQLKQARVEKNSKIYERNNFLLDFLFYSGVRINELVNIKHQDWLGESLRVRGKGNKVRFVLLRDFLIAKIHPYRKGYLFTNQRGRQIKTEYIRWLLKARTQQAQIRKRITPHTFRRSFATLLHNNGAHLTSIQRLLGHTSITTTASYIHNDFDFLRADYSKLWNPKPQKHFSLMINLTILPLLEKYLVENGATPRLNIPFLTRQNKYNVELQNWSDYQDLRKGIITFRQSGIRVKSPDCFPCLTHNPALPIIYDHGYRYLTQPELMALQSFPPTYQFPNNYSLTKIASLLGNSANVKAIKYFVRKFLSPEKTIKFIDLFSGFRSLSFSPPVLRRMCFGSR